MEIVEQTFCAFIQDQDVPCVCESTSICDAMGIPGLSIFSPIELAKILKEDRLKFRIGMRNLSELQWEGCCKFVEATLSEFLSWYAINDCNKVEECGAKLQQQFGACCKKHYWCYADYIYMRNLFKNHKSILRLLDWSNLGFQGKDGKDSTIWLGSDGAHTVCHYDQYGFNIVMQMCGSKKWTLFPPSETKFLYPTRIPYEESSVFSDVNIKAPDFTKHPRFSSATPYVVVLKPGDILYVPHHWWHFVENLELSVSINLWYDLEIDAHGRFTEAVTRLIVGNCARSEPHSEPNWINPTEDLAEVHSIPKGLQYLNQSLREVRNNGNANKVCGYSKQVESDPTQVSVRRFQNVDGDVIIKPLSPDNLEIVGTEGGVKRQKLEENVKQERFLSSQSENKFLRSDINWKDFVKCLSDQRVVDVVSDILFEKYVESNDE